MIRNVSRDEVEDFLYREAELLDSWKLDVWADLFDDQGEYLIPSTDVPDASPRDTLFLVYDDRHRLGERAKRLLKPQAHAEQPRSKTRHLIANVIVEPADGDTVPVKCSFVVYRSRGEKSDIYPGHMTYLLSFAEDGSLRIRSKRVVLDIEALVPQGKVSIIL